MRLQLRNNIQKYRKYRLSMLGADIVLNMILVCVFFLPIALLVWAVVTGNLAEELP